MFLGTRGVSLQREGG
jgi:hypothetical protein